MREGLLEEWDQNLEVEGRGSTRGKEGLVQEGWAGRRGKGSQKSKGLVEEEGLAEEGMQKRVGQQTKSS